MEINEEDVIGFDALYSSMQKCKKGVSRKNSVANYCLHGLERTINLSDELEADTYKPGNPYHFSVTSPKPRDIVSIGFRDRVYQRSLNDNSVYPQMTKSFIHDNMACQKEKGTDEARNRLHQFLYGAYQKWGTNFTIVQIDIHGYYPNMQHKTVEELFAAGLDEWTYKKVINTLHNQYPGEIGYNPGSQMVQIAGISVLNKTDHHMKERVKIKYYIRYMDDIIMIVKDKKDGRYALYQFGEKLNELNFEFNPKKTKIYDATDGVPFLGFIYTIKKSGKVVVTCSSKNVKNQKRKLHKLVNLVKRGERTKQQADDAFQAWVNHASHGDSHKLIRRMKKYYKNLWDDYTEPDEYEDYIFME